jgi:hypothetical protein
MQYPDKLELARARVAQAQDAFDDYLRTGKYSPERGRELADALKAARDQYVDQLEALFPKISD